MSRIIVAYDGTPHAEDALALGLALSELGGWSVGLAHVHRADPQKLAPSAADRGRESFLQRQGELLLERAVKSLNGRAATVTTHAVAGATTATALRRLAESEDAQIIVFGSAYNGPAGRVHPGSAARRLLQSASCAIAVAPAGFRAAVQSKPSSVAFADDDERGSARTTAELLAASAGASVEDGASGADLLVVGSRADAAEGHVKMAPSTERLVQASTSPVIVLASGAPLRAEAPVASSQAA
jgi:nucleotide-binding universal stress UspA family protein